MDIERNPRLRKAWIAYLEKQQLDRAYVMATSDVEVHYFVNHFMDRMVPGEAQHFSQHHKAYVKRHNRLLVKSRRVIAAKYGISAAEAETRMGRDRAFLNEVYAALYAHRHWARFIRVVQRHILTTCNTLAASAVEGGFKASNPYRAYRQGALDPKKTGAKMDLLDIEKDRLSDPLPLFATRVKARTNWRFRWVIADRWLRPVLFPGVLAKAMGRPPRC